VVASGKRSSSYRRRVADDQAARPEQNRTFTGKVVLWLIVAVLLLILVLQNASDTTVDIYFWDVTVSLWVLMLGSLLVGVLLGYFLPKLRRGRRGDDD
jgi:uncharacterized integral membrane protein